MNTGPSLILISVINRHVSQGEMIELTNHTDGLMDEIYIPLGQIERKVNILIGQYL